MNENEPSRGDARTPDCEPVRCRRTGQTYDPCEHERCPYCFGEAKDVAPGEYEKFCDFEPGKDPVAFGFPEGGKRFRDG